jgi:hypothetical protein
MSYNIGGEWENVTLGDRFPHFQQNVNREIYNSRME